MHDIFGAILTVELCSDTSMYFTLITNILNNIYSGGLQIHMWLICGFKIGPLIQKWTLGTNDSKIDRFL